MSLISRREQKESVLSKEASFGLRIENRLSLYDNLEKKNIV